MYYLKCTVLSLPHSKNGNDISWLTFLSKASPCLFFSFPCLNLLLWMYLSALPLLPLASAISSNNDLILRSVPKLKCGKNLQLAERLACCRWTFLYKAVFFFCARGTLKFDTRVFSLCFFFFFKFQWLFVLNLTSRQSLFIWGVQVFVFGLFPVLCELQLFA